jgi:hypothetical protein
MDLIQWCAMHTVSYIVSDTSKIPVIRGSFPLRMGKSSRSGIFRNVRFYARYADAEEMQRAGDIIVDMERIGLVIDQTTKRKRHTTFGRVYAPLNMVCLQDLMLRLHSNDRHLYESLSTVPTKLVLDIDRRLPGATTHDDIQRLDVALKLHFIPFLCEVLNDLISMPPSIGILSPSDFLVLDASLPSYKYSKHLIMTTRTNLACSPRRDIERVVMTAFRERLCDRCLSDSDLRSFCYFHECGAPERKESVDFGIYSDGKRSMRLPACCKGDGKQMGGVPRLLLPDGAFCCTELPINKFMCNVFAPDIAVSWSTRTSLLTCMPRPKRTRESSNISNGQHTNERTICIPHGVSDAPTHVTRCLEQIASTVHPNYTSRSVSCGHTPKSIPFQTMMINYKAASDGGDRVCAFGCEKHTRHYASVSIYGDGASDYFCFGCQETTVLCAPRNTESTTPDQAPQNDGEFVEMISRHIPGCTLTQCSVQYLPSCPLQLNLDFAETCITRSGMGTGKTFMLANYIQHLRQSHSELRVISIGFRQTLNTALSSRLGLENYLTTLTPSLHAIPRLSVQLDSLPRLLVPGHGDGVFELPSPYDVVIIDEIESLLTHFTSATMQDKAMLCWRILECILCTCTKLVVCDADLGDRSIAFLSGLGRDPHRTCVLRNTFSPYPTKHIIVHNVVTFTKKLFRHAVKMKRKIYLASNSKIFAHHAHSILSASGLAVLLIEGASPPSVKAAAADCDTTWGNYDVVICTPAVAAGIDCSIRHFDDVFVYGTNGSNTGRELNQQRGRVRHVASRTVYVCIDTVRKPFGVETGLSCVDIKNTMDGIVGGARGLFGDIRRCVLPAIAGEMGALGIRVTMCPTPLLRIIATSRMERDRSVRNMTREYERAVAWADSKAIFKKLPSTKVRYASMLAMEISNLSIAHHEAETIACAPYAPSCAMDDGMADVALYRKAKLGSFYGGVDFRSPESVFHFAPDSRQCAIKCTMSAMLPLAYLFMADQSCDGAFSTRTLVDLAMHINVTVHHRIVLEDRLPSWVQRIFAIILLYAAGCRGVSVDLSHGDVKIPDANIIAAIFRDGMCSKLSTCRLTDQNLQDWMRRQLATFVGSTEDTVGVFDAQCTIRIARKWISQTYGVTWENIEVKRARNSAGTPTRNTMTRPKSDVFRLNLLGVCLHCYTHTPEVCDASRAYKTECMQLCNIQQVEKEYLLTEVFLSDYTSAIPTMAELRRRTSCKVGLGVMEVMSVPSTCAAGAWAAFNVAHVLSSVENVIECLYVDR